jgi:hypothetical protein
MDFDDILTIKTFILKRGQLEDYSKISKIVYLYPNIRFL